MIRDPTTSRSPPLLLPTTSRSPPLLPPTAQDKPISLQSQLPTILSAVPSVAINDESMNEALSLNEVNISVIHLFSCI